MTMFRNVERKYNNQHGDGSERGNWIGTLDVSAVSETLASAMRPSVGFGAWNRLEYGMGGDIRTGLLEMF